MSYEAARINPVSLGFHSRNRNRGSGVDNSTDGLALPLILRWKTMVPPHLVRWRGEVATAELYGAAVGAMCRRVSTPRMKWLLLRSKFMSCLFWASRFGFLSSDPVCCPNVEVKMDSNFSCALFENWPQDL